MLPAVNKTFSPVDHMIPSIKRCTWENSGQTYGNNTAVAHAPGITALLNFDTSHEGNAGEKNRGEKRKCYRAVLIRQRHADLAEQSADNTANQWGCFRSCSWARQPCLKWEAWTWVEPSLGLDNGLSGGSWWHWAQTGQMTPRWHQLKKRHVEAGVIIDRCSNTHTHAYCIYTKTHHRFDIYC